MGYKDKSYKKDLHQQAYDRLKNMQAFGESKKEAVREDTASDKIFSYNTYKTYWKHIKYFTKWINENHPDCETLKKAKKYVPEWLQTRVEQGLSAWTIHTEEAALNKLYGIKPDDTERFQAPKRNRYDIKRSRGDTERDKHFSEKNNNELIKFCRATGLRRSELINLCGGDLITKDQILREIDNLKNIKGRHLMNEELEKLDILNDAVIFDEEYFLFVRCGKGGRKRISPIVGNDAEKVIERIKNTSAEENVWQYVSSNADIHSYRSEYATAIYKNYARKIEEIPYDRINQGTGRAYQSDVYTCRKDEAGKKLDKAAMLICSKALGHNRISVVADNYIRGL